ncbi:MAG: phytanoyl-CoA dioxygenase family protein [Chitinophagales bacterium]
MLHTFSPDAKEEIASYYHENGYAIVKGLISKALIDRFLIGYNELKQKSNYIVRAQDTNRPEKLYVNQQGFIEHSLWNPHEMVFCDSFSSGIFDIITQKNITDILTAITAEQKQTLWQSMFFDKSTGTVAHQDHYYLDTDPIGGVVGVWIAVEDIDPKAGPFYVCPKTHLSTISSRDADHNDGYVNAVAKYMNENKIERLACPIQKGDVIFWHSLTIHGSFENQDASFSRKSITAHYFPSKYTQLGAKNAGGVVPKPATMATPNPNLEQWQSSDLKRKITYLRKSARYFINTITNKPVTTEMKTKDGKYIGEKVE